MNTELIPVIHMLDEQQVVKNVEMCLYNGVDKVFIINHAVEDTILQRCAWNIKNSYPIWVGINRLAVSAYEAVNTLDLFHGLWCDLTITKTIADKRQFGGMLFGGLAFKYQPQPSDLKTACEEAIQTTDVATTSGVGTGKAANVEKIHLIREYLGEHPMAIASGVTAENIENYKGVADYLLVASSITDYREMLIESKLAELRSKLD